MVRIQDPGGKSIPLQLSLLSRSRRDLHTRLQQCSRGPEELEKNKGLIPFSGQAVGTDRRVRNVRAGQFIWLKGPFFGYEDGVQANCSV